MCHPFHLPFRDVAVGHALAHDGGDVGLVLLGEDVAAPDAVDAREDGVDPASDKTEDDKQGYDIMLQEKAMEEEEEERKIAEYGNQY